MSPTSQTDAKRLVVVAGSGRSGTSTVAGVLSYLGLHVPPPQVEANESNPRGFFEPRWVVDFQTRLLRRARVELTDARPDAFETTQEIGSDPKVQRELQAWLGPVLEAADEIIVKDPRDTWFLPMWREAGAAFGVVPSYLTMLRHPAEVVGSKAKYYGGATTDRQPKRGPQSQRAGGWLNVMLFGELATRDASRTFVRYDDLLADWRGAMTKAGAELDLSFKAGFPDAGAAEIDSFIDPDLRRVQTTLDDIDIPDVLKQMCADVWEQINALADAGGSDPAIEASLDASREAYVGMYLDAEAIAHSSIMAARPRGAKKQPSVPEPTAPLARRVARRARQALKPAKP